jgi:uncharacterized damage-inducible protein DinB
MMTQLFFLMALAMSTSTTTPDPAKMADYNLWANQQIVQWLKQASPEQFQQEVPSSFNTLEKTVAHLWHAEFGWLCTIEDRPWSRPDTTFSHPLHMLDAFLATSEQFQESILSLKQEDLQQTRALGSSQKPVTIADIVLHVCNHATYHRGQLITMGRQVGLPDPPRTDYIYFVMQQVRQ